MKAVKTLVIVLVVYAGIVATFESMIGFFQPEAGEVLTITTTNESGETNDRVLARLENNGQMFIAANHWPRAWYNQALANPNVEVSIEGEKKPYLAVQVSDEEHARLTRDHDNGLVFRIITGFPPRYFLRLDPR